MWCAAEPFPTLLYFVLGGRLHALFITKTTTRTINNNNNNKNNNKQENDDVTSAFFYKQL